MPFPIIEVASNNGSEFINHQLLDWCEQRAAHRCNVLSGHATRLCSALAERSKDAARCGPSVLRQGFVVDMR